MAKLEREGGPGEEAHTHRHTPGKVNNFIKQISSGDIRNSITPVWVPQMRKVHRYTPAEVLSDSAPVEPSWTPRGTTLEPLQNPRRILVPGAFAEPAQPSQNPRGTLARTLRNLTSEVTQTKTTPEPIWAETPSLSAGEKSSLLSVWLGLGSNPSPCAGPPNLGTEPPTFEDRGCCPRAWRTSRKPAPASRWRQARCRLCMWG